MKHYTVPIFVPELACPNRCVFCNQNSISGCHSQPSSDEVKQIIENRLHTIPAEGNRIEIGFFGGNFTGIEERQQIEYLEIAFSYLKQNKVHGIRLSTRPDYITPRSLDLLKQYGVSTIELGAQSLDDEVLKSAGRGHTVRDIEVASALIIKYGFRLGLQMMTGLPGDTPEKSMQTARKIIQLGASDTRIYPTLVIRNTELEQRWRNGIYKPQSLEEAVILTAGLIELFESAGVNIIRVGLHPSEDLLNGNDLLAGPFHPSFRQLAESEIWRRKFAGLINEHPGGSDIDIPVPASELNSAIGYEGSNRQFLLNHFSNVNFIPTGSIGQPIIIADKRIPLPAKNALRNLGELVLLDENYTVYKSIAAHPDIFFCKGDEKIIVAPDVPEAIRSRLAGRGYTMIEGSDEPGDKYPATAMYNAVVTSELLIHNLKITDSRITETFDRKRHIHVNQGYTRCNLLALSEKRFITSDRGIEKVLLNEGLDVLWVDPVPVVLRGQKHGFFPGCCGILGNHVLINGSLLYHPEGENIRKFIIESGLLVKELFNGRLTDAGSILTFTAL